MAPPQKVHTSQAASVFRSRSTSVDPDNDREAQLTEREVAVTKREETVAKREKIQKDVLAKAQKVVADLKEVQATMRGHSTQLEGVSAKIRGQSGQLEDVQAKLRAPRNGATVTDMTLTSRSGDAGWTLASIDLSDGTKMRKHGFTSFVAHDIPAPAPRPQYSATTRLAEAPAPVPRQRYSSAVRLVKVLPPRTAGVRKPSYRPAPKRVKKHLIVAADLDKPDEDESDSEMMGGSYVEVKEEPEE